MEQQTSDGDVLADEGRPAQVTASGTILIAFGAFITLLGAAMLVLGGLFLDLTSLPSWVDPPSGDFRAGSLAIGAGIGVFGLAQLVAGVQVLRGRGWAQVGGIVVALLGALVAGIALLQGFGASATGVTTIFLPVVVAYGYTAWGLATASDWFRRT